MKKCYISGQISDLRPHEYYHNFDIAEKQVRDQGMTPVSPLDNTLPTEAPWIFHMVIDIITLLTCDCIALQPNWMKSRGAKIERKIALFTKKTVYYLP